MRSDRIARLQGSCAARAYRPLPAGRLPLLLQGRRCGWIDSRAAACLAQPSLPFELRDGAFQAAPGIVGFEALSQALQVAALRLRDAGLVRHWRGEQLDVRDELGIRVATIERAATRVLGISTRSVHLNAFAVDGTLVAAQRAQHKPSDPGRWDNLAGGMVAAGEDDRQALAREAQEEAGLELAGLALQLGREWPVQRPVDEGLMIERVQVFDVQLPSAYTPENRDGEVASFRAWDVDEALQAIERGEFTLEASLATLDALERRAAG